MYIHTFRLCVTDYTVFTFSVDHCQKSIKKTLKGQQLLCIRLYDTETLRPNLHDCQLKNTETCLNCVTVKLSIRATIYCTYKVI